MENKEGLNDFEIGYTENNKDSFFTDVLEDSSYIERAYNSIHDRVVRILAKASVLLRGKL